MTLLTGSPSISPFISNSVPPPDKGFLQPVLWVRHWAGQRACDTKDILCPSVLLVCLHMQIDTCQPVCECIHRNMSAKVKRDGWWEGFQWVLSETTNNRIGRWGDTYGCEGAQRPSHKALHHVWGQGDMQRYLELVEYRQGRRVETTKVDTDMGPDHEAPCVTWRAFSNLLFQK